MRIGVSIFAVVLALGGLAGCAVPQDTTALPDNGAESSAPPTSAAPTSAAPTPSPSTTPPAESPSTEPDSTSPRALGKKTPSNPEGLGSTRDDTHPNYFSEGNNFGMNFGWDGGPIDGARGTTTFDSDKHPVSYTVAPGDSLDKVDERFTLPALYYLNCARRGSFDLWAGDILNLSPYTIATVGTENGSSTRVDKETRKGCLANPGVPEQF